MGFIESTYNSTIIFINGIGQSQYSAMASDLGYTAQVISMILVIVVLINMGSQTRPMSASESIWLMVKLTLVALFMRNWTQFDAVFLAFSEMFELLGERMLAASLGETETTSFARELDKLSFKTSSFANVTAGRLNILGSVMNVLMVFLIGALGAFATLALIITKIVLAVLIAVAPIAIVASLTSYTKSFFESWLSAVISMMMYPLILSGVFATVLAMGNATISTLDTDADITVGTIIPVVMVVMLSIIMVVLSPIILSLITGSIQVGNLASSVSSVLSKPVSAAARSGSAAAGGFGRGLMGSDQTKSDAGMAAKTGRAVGGAARDTASFMKNPVANTRAGVNRRADQINRAAERMARLRRK